MSVLTMLAFTANAEQSKLFKLQKPVLCGEAEMLLEVLQKKMDMKPVFTSFPEKGRNTTYILMISASDRKWTMVETDNETACLVAEGMSRINSIDIRPEKNFD